MHSNLQHHLMSADQKLGSKTRTDTTTPRSILLTSELNKLHTNKARVKPFNNDKGDTIGTSVSTVSVYVEEKHPIVIHIPDSSHTCGWLLQQVILYLK